MFAGYFFFRFQAAVCINEDECVGFSPEKAKNRIVFCSACCVVRMSEDASD